MLDKNAVVAVYETHSQVEAAIKELHRSGIDIKKMSIVAKDHHTEEQVVGYYNAGDRMKRWGSSGAVWGGFWGLLFGSAFFAVPGIGPVLVAGPMVSWIIGALEGAIAIGGVTAIGAGLYSIGIPRDSILRYESAVKADQYVLLAHGTIKEVEQAKAIMRTTEPLEVGVHTLRTREAIAVGAL